jgi:hypothetical protein
MKVLLIPAACLILGVTSVRLKVEQNQLVAGIA